MALSVDLKGFPGVTGAVVADGNQAGSWSDAKREDADGHPQDGRNPR